MRGVVYTSSIGAYANAEIFKEGEPGDFHDAPMDFAGWAKRIAELQVHAYRTQYGMEQFAIVRPSNVYGPGDNFDPENAMVVPTLMHRIDTEEHPVVVWGDGSAIRDIVYSRDVAEGVVLAFHHGTRGRYVNLGAGAASAIRELVETLHGFLAFNYRFDVTKPSGFPKRVMDISRAREFIDYSPSTITAGRSEGYLGLVHRSPRRIQAEEELLQGLGHRPRRLFRRMGADVDE